MRWFGELYGLHPMDGYQLLSQITEVPIANVVDANYSAVVKARKSLLPDAQAPHPFSADPYLRDRQARSVVCVPLVRQSELVGILYLENNLAPDVFTNARIAVLLGSTSEIVSTIKEKLALA